MKISILTVSFNAADTIEETIYSVVSQTYNDIEYIIVDGGSSDGTMDIVNKYRDKISIVVSEPDNGIYDAINKGQRLATGDFLLIIGADDHLLSSRTISKAVRKLSSQNMVYYGDVYFEADNILHPKRLEGIKRARYNYCHQAIFYPRKIYKNYEYNTRFVLFADYDYNLRLTREFEFCYINETISYYAHGGASCNSRRDTEWIKIENACIKQYLGWCPYLYKRFVDMYWWMSATANHLKYRICNCIKRTN